MNEEWKDIPNTKGRYQISNLGRVKSLVKSKEIIRKPSFNTYTGYDQMGLRIDGKSCTFLLHKLVATSFIPNPNNYPRINHINRDKRDNRAENLEYCSQLQNIHHYYNSDESNKPRQMKAVCVYDLEGVFLAEYPSINQAKNFNGGWPGNIFDCCEGKQKKHKGHIYKYKR